MKSEHLCDEARSKERTAYVPSSGAGGEKRVRKIVTMRLGSLLFKASQLHCLFHILDMRHYYSPVSTRPCTSYSIVDLPANSPELPSGTSRKGRADH